MTSQTRKPESLRRDRSLRAPSAEGRHVAELARMVERLLSRGHLPDAVERFVASWMREGGRGTREVPAVVRAARVDALLGRQAVRRIDAYARGGLDAVQTSTSDRPVRPLRVRDAEWFEHMHDEAAAARWALPARACLEAAPVYALAFEARAPGAYVQRDASDAMPAEGGPRVADILRRLGAGRALPAAAQSTLENRLAALGRPLDLGPVRVHDGPEAAALCRELRANAFAVGRHGVFAAGRYQPGDEAGLALIAHELTHVWQQATGLVAPHAAREDKGLEADARSIQAAFVAAPPAAPREVVAPLEPAATPDAGAAAELGVPQRDAAGPAAPEAQAPKSAPRPAGGDVPRGRNRDALVGETRKFLADAKLRPGAIFIVGDRIDAYDATMRARGSWPIHGRVPLRPGFWLDGGVDVASWSALTPAKIAEIGGGRADDLWVVAASDRGAAAGAGAKRAAGGVGCGRTASPPVHAAPEPAALAPAPAPGPAPAPASPQSPAAAPAPGGDLDPAVAKLLATPSTPVAPAIAKRFEAATGVDVSHAKVHVSDLAGVAAAHGGGLAYGDHVVFAAPNPDERLLFHELTHVAQQTGGGGTPAEPGPKTGRAPSPEAEADAVAAAILAHGRASVTLGQKKAVIGDDPAAAPAKKPVTLSADDWKKANAENEAKRAAGVFVYNQLELAVGAKLVFARGAAQNGVTGDSQKAQSWEDALGPTSLAIAEKQDGFKLPVTGIADDATLEKLGFVKKGSTWRLERSASDWQKTDAEDDQKLAKAKTDAAAVGTDASKGAAARRAAIVTFAQSMIGTVDSTDRGDGKKSGGGRIVDIYNTLGGKPVDKTKEGDLRGAGRFAGDSYKKWALGVKPGLVRKRAAGTATPAELTQLATIEKTDLTQEHVGDWSWCGMFAVYCVKVATGIGGWSAAPTGMKAIPTHGKADELAAAKPEPGDVLAVQSTNNHCVLLAAAPAADGTGPLSIIEGNIEAQGIRASTRLTAANITVVYKPL
ncbi:MAG: DUF4157 domain-containing protein [Myxococcota bacterium]